MVTRCFFLCLASVNIASPVWLQLYHWLWKCLFLQQRQKPVFFFKSVVQHPLKKWFPVCFNIIRYYTPGEKKLHKFCQDIASLIKSISRFLNAERSRSEVWSNDSKWSWLWFLCSWENRYTALTPNCFRHFNPREKNEVRDTQKKSRSGKSEHPNSEAKK